MRRGCRGFELGARMLRKVSRASAVVKERISWVQHQHMHMHDRRIYQRGAVAVEIKDGSWEEGYGGMPSVVEGGGGATSGRMG
eukprot:scaffold219301_cov72-Attheya_sp.AAC.1